MNKEQIIEIAEGLQFTLDLDRYDEKGWMRFQLKDKLDEQDLRLIWRKENSLEDNLSNAAEILFKAGQKAFKQRFDEYINLY